MEHETWHLKRTAGRVIIGLAVGTLVLTTLSLAGPLQEQSDEVIVALDAAVPLANRSGHAAAISPDGGSVVYVAEREGEHTELPE